MAEPTATAQVPPLASSLPFRKKFASLADRLAESEPRELIALLEHPLWTHTPLTDPQKCLVFYTAGLYAAPDGTHRVRTRVLGGVQGIHRRALLDEDHAIALTGWTPLAVYVAAGPPGQEDVAWRLFWDTHLGKGIQRILWYLRKPEQIPSDEMFAEAVELTQELVRFDDRYDYMFDLFKVACFAADPSLTGTLRQVENPLAILAFKGGDRGQGRQVAFFSGKSDDANLPGYTQWADFLTLLLRGQEYDHFGVALAGKDAVRWVSNPPGARQKDGPWSPWSFAGPQKIALSLAEVTRDVLRLGDPPTSISIQMGNFACPTANIESCLRSIRNDDADLGRIFGRSSWFRLDGVWALVGDKARLMTYFRGANCVVLRPVAGTQLRFFTQVDNFEVAPITLTARDLDCGLARSDLIEFLKRLSYATQLKIRYQGNEVFHGCDPDGFSWRVDGSVMAWLDRGSMLSYMSAYYGFQDEFPGHDTSERFARYLRKWHRRHRDLHADAIANELVRMQENLAGYTTADSDWDRQVAKWLAEADADNPLSLRSFFGTVKEIVKRFGLPTGHFSDTLPTLRDILLRLNSLPPVDPIAVFTPEPYSESAPPAPPAFGPVPPGLVERGFEDPARRGQDRVAE